MTATTTAAMDIRTPSRAVHGSTLDRLPYDDLRSFFSVLDLARNADPRQWQQGGIQAFLPHQARITAWGDFAGSQIRFDAVSPMPHARAAHFDDERTRLLLRQLFDRWLLGRRTPFATSIAGGLPALQQDSAITGSWGDAAETDTVLVHGIKDHRGRYDCLYVLFGADALAAEPAADVFGLLLPYLDAAHRQEQQVPAQHPATGPMVGTIPTTSDDHGLSQREVAILDWIGRGKTNLEIGMILDISAFTVKNHLRRIFRKLDVISRAQAIAKVKPSGETEPHR